jgi:hypothetical protein
MVVRRHAALIVAAQVAPSRVVVCFGTGVAAPQEPDISNWRREKQSSRAAQSKPINSARKNRNALRKQLVPPGCRTDFRLSVFFPNAFFLPKGEERPASRASFSKGGNETPINPDAQALRAIGVCPTLCPKSPDQG